MKKQFVHSIVFFILLSALFIPALKLVFAPAPPQFFNVTVQITNAAPRIHNITINGASPPFSATPLENTHKNISIVFNVSDGNGQADIVDTTISATLNFTGTVKTNFTGCALLDTGTLDKRYNCTLLFDYFDENSTLYTLNITVADASNARSENFTNAAFTYNTLTAITLSISGASQQLTFSTSPGTMNVRPTADQIVRNTGNDAFRILNLTGFDLNGASQILGATNFTVNFTNSTNGGGNLIGQIMGNGTTINLTNSSIDVPILPRQNNSNVTLYFSVNVSAVLTEKSFNASRLWNISVDRNKP